MKKVFICCSADRRLVLEAKAQVYKKWELTEQLERARPYGSRAKWRLDRGNEADDQKSRRVEYRHRLF